SRTPRVGGFYLLTAAGFVGGAFVSRLHSLSYINVLLPAYLIAAIVLAIATADVAATGLDRWHGAARRRVTIAVYLLCLLQLLRVGYRPGAFVPDARDVAAGRQFVQRIAEMPGDVYVVDHGYLPALAGKQMHAHGAVLADVLRGGTRDVEHELAAA